MKLESRKRAIDKVYKRRDRIDIPDFQRGEVWPVKKKRLLINSILKGWHLPKFYFRKVDNENYECIDGQQRLAAIFQFFVNEFSLDSETSPQSGKLEYDQLLDDESDAFDDFEIDIEEIDNATDEELEELFKRLQLGTPLNTAEKLNAISGDLRNFCHRMSDEPFFKNSIGLRDTRYSHFEIVTKLAFIVARGIQTHMRLPQLDSFLSGNKTFSMKSDISKRINKTIKFLNSAFPNKCPSIRNKANALSLCMLAERVTHQNIIEKEAAINFGKFTESFFKQLSIEVEKGVDATDRDSIKYQQAISAGSNTGTSIENRINILTSRISIYQPCFAPLVEAYDEVNNVARSTVVDISTRNREMVNKINIYYEATNKETLFKMTTKSSQALSIISVLCLDKSKFGEFCDALYYIIYEGSGNCNRLPSPPPKFAMDVKKLRTIFRHDIDHGDKNKFKRKLTDQTEIFEKYSGKKTPEECGPEDFLTSQIRILNEMETFLDMLSK